jgi:shikimate kinase
MAPRIVLIGPMGAGKTTVGEEVARRLNCSFADTDQIIETDQGKSISEIFIEDGEPHFRLVEESIVIDALLAESGVLSLGGGAVANDATQNALADCSAKKIFLDISLSAVSPRVGFDSARPLLMVNPRQKWAELMSARRPIYESLADLKIDVSEKTVDEIASQIVETL